MKQIQKGFTLIELIVVIVILGILAATALPKFVDLSGDAGNASAQGVAGALSSATSINYAKFQINSGGAVAISSGSSCTGLLGNAALMTSVPAEVTASAGATVTGCTAGTTGTCALSHQKGTTAANATIVCTS